MLKIRSSQSNDQLCFIGSQRQRVRSIWQEGSLVDVCVCIYGRTTSSATDRPIIFTHLFFYVSVHFIRHIAISKFWHSSLSLLPIYLWIEPTTICNSTRSHVWSDTVQSTSTDDEHHHQRETHITHPREGNKFERCSSISSMDLGEAHRWVMLLHDVIFDNLRSEDDEQKCDDARN